MNLFWASVFKTNEKNNVQFFIRVEASSMKNKWSLNREIRILLLLLFVLFSITRKKPKNRSNFKMYSSGVKSKSTTCVLKTYKIKPQLTGYYSFICVCWLRNKRRMPIIVTYNHSKIYCKFCQHFFLDFCIFSVVINNELTNPS